MTEKQFFVTNGKHMVLEHEFYKGKNRLSPSQVIDLLNDLHEENQALKSDRVRYEEECRLDVFKELNDENEKFKKALIELKEIGDYQYSRIKELSDENEQLKKGMIEVVDRSIRNVEHNPPSSVRTYSKVKGALVNVREGLRDLLEDLK